MRGSIGSWGSGEMPLVRRALEPPPRKGPGTFP